MKGQNSMENLTKGERQKRNYELRCSFWDNVGEVDDDELSFLINPSFMGQPSWPDLRQTYIRIVTESSVILATDGLSDEFSDADLPNNGFEIELYVELNDPEYLKMSISELGETCAFQLLKQAALNAAYSGAYKQTADKFGAFSTEFYNVDATDEYKNKEGRVGALIGVERKTVPAKVQLFASEV